MQKEPPLHTHTHTIGVMKRENLTLTQYLINMNQKRLHLFILFTEDPVILELLLTCLKHTHGAKKVQTRFLYVYTLVFIKKKY